MVGNTSSREPSNLRHFGFLAFPDSRTSAFFHEESLREKLDAGSVREYLESFWALALFGSFSKWGSSFGVPKALWHPQ